MLIYCVRNAQPYYCNAKIIQKKCNKCNAKGNKMSNSSKMGRPLIDKEPIKNNLTIRFSDRELREIEELAKKLDMPKTRFIRNLTLSGLEDAKTLDKVGVLKGAQKLIDFKERLLNPEKFQTLQNA